MKKIVRYAAWTVGALVAVLLVAAAALYAYTGWHISRKWSVAGHALAIPTDSLAIARGRHVATAISRCTGCHGRDFGGQVFIDAPPFAFLYAANLTRGRGGIGGQLTDLDWERAIRHGVKPDGSVLLFMPSREFQMLNDQDAAALIAYLKTLPPVNREPLKNRVGPIGRALYAKGDVALIPAELIDQTAAHPPATPEGITAEYGRYVVDVGGCKGCHGPGLSGGHIPGTPPDWKPAANITPTGIGHYAEDDFFRALREGKRPGGASIDPLMPFEFTKNLTDDEIRALWLYLKTVPPKAFGGR
jgi:cytochrome c553